jgi:zinc-ribbon domain
LRFTPNRLYPDLRLTTRKGEYEMFCPSCGKPLVPGKRFCGECGAVVAAETNSTVAPAPSVASVSSVAAKKPLPALLGIGLLLLMFALLFLAKYAIHAGLQGDNDAPMSASGIPAILPFPVDVVKNSDIDVVKNGVLADYNTTTVGKAFEGTFQNATWRSLKTSKGVTVVEFKGTMKLPELVAKFGLSSACQKQLAELRNSCIASEHLSDKFTEMMSDKERDELHNCVEARGVDQETPISFQFTLSADKQSFEITYTDLSRTNLAAIYH